MNKMLQQKGFTLVELMVVILIISILMAVALPTYLNVRVKANDCVSEQNLINAARIAVSYYASNQSMPTADDLNDESASFIFINADSVTKAKNPPEIAIGSDYYLRVVGNDSRLYKINIEDGKIGKIIIEE